MASEYHPKPIIGIAVYGIISGELGLLCALSWMPAWGTGSILGDIFSFAGMPLDAMCLIASVGLLMLQPWSRKWMYWWAIAATVFATIDLPIGLAYAQDMANSLPADIKSQLQEAFGNSWQDMLTQIVQLVDWIGWLGTLSLSVWAWWVMRRPRLIPYFESSHGTGEVKITQIAATGRTE